MANMLSGTKIVEADCGCHKCTCGCTHGNDRPYAIKHVKRMARRKEQRFWKADQDRNAS